MGFPTLDCRGPASEVARKQSPRLLREVSSLSRSWKRGSAPEMKMKHRREGLKAGTPLGAEKRTSIQHSGVGVPRGGYMNRVPVHRPLVSRGSCLKCNN